MGDSPAYFNQNHKQRNITVQHIQTALFDIEVQPIDIDYFNIMVVIITQFCWPYLENGTEVANFSMIVNSTCHIR